MNQAVASVPVYDCLVLSGGGAKGSYGAGVAKGLEEYRALKGITSRTCYIGTSAGALNASVLATSSADKLISFWRAMSGEKVTGTRFGAGMKARWAWRGARFKAGLDHSFSVFSNDALAGLINDNTSFPDLGSGAFDLVVTATNYTTGTLTSFYSSALIEQFITHDEQLTSHKRRLTHWKKVRDEEHLRRALLASTAIPVAFPPVVIDKDWYIDGGVGNHTPTREAAYFLRHLEKMGLGRAGEVICVTQDTPRTLIEGKHKPGPLTLLLRTFDVYHFVHTTPIIDAWYRINREVDQHNEKLRLLKEHVATLGIGKEATEQIGQAIDAQLGTIGGATARLNFPMTLVQPSTQLGETLDFDPKTISENIERGYTDVLKLLEARGRLDASECRNLVNKRLQRGAS